MCNERAFDIVLEEFLKIAEIPRPSHHEERISAYLRQWACIHGLKAQIDSLGNVIIDKPASLGYEAVPRVILQAHMDMVCVAAEGISYDPLNDPIKVINDGITLRAEGTSLGADDGIAIAICLYLLGDNSLRHGPLRAIFTVNEEDGMASKDIEAEYLDGGYLINLDWETIGSLCNSSAGGDYFNFSRKAVREAPPAGCKTMTLSFNKLLGGHSGVGINKGHANAIVSIATALSLLRQGGIEYRIAEFSGGQAKNAIPAHCTAVITLAGSDCEKAESILSRFHAEFLEAFGNIENTGLWSVHVKDIPPALVLDREIGYGLVDIVTALPNNVHTMSPFIDGLVESSSNLGVLSTQGDMVTLTVFARSSVAYQATQLGVICQIIAERCSYDFEAEGHMPGWAVNPASKLTKICCETYEKLTGETMIVEPVHAGVECGAFAEKNPRLDMIAIGPTLLDVHTPEESCSLADVKVTIELLVAILEAITS